MQQENSCIPEITNEPFPPTFDTPESYNQLNTLLSYYKLPNIDSNDLPEVKIEKLREICQNKYLSIADTELTSLSDILNGMREYKEIEKQCDNWEIELANMSSEDSRKYGGRTVEELQLHLDSLKRNFHNQEKYKENRKTIEEVQVLTEYLMHDSSNSKSKEQVLNNFLENSELQKELLSKRHSNSLNSHTNEHSYDSPLKKSKIISESSLQALGSLKEETFGAYVKQKVIDKLIGRQEEWAVVLCKIVKENQCKVETLKVELGIDRVNLLRIIYNYSSKGILEYDRLNDTVSLVDN